MFVLVLVLTPVYHLEGVAIAQVCQALFILLVALILIYRISPYNRFGYWKWSKKSFKELFNYGYKFQVVSICQLLYEPTTKLLLSKFGGLAVLGHYEMATRLVSQFRALLVNANQVVVPVVAENSKTKTKEEMQGFFKVMNQILLMFSLPLSTLLLIISPFISIIWIGDVNANFVFSMLVLTTSAAINIMAGPSYFSCMGEGRLSILVIIHISMAVMNIVFGYLLGVFAGGYGIITAWGIALSLGSVFLIVAYSKTISLNFSVIFSRNDIFLLLASLILSIFTIFIFGSNILKINSFTKTIVLIGVYFAVFIPIIAKNKSFLKLVSDFRLRKS